jgi:hypothetical protein
MSNRETPEEWAQLFGLNWNPNDPEIPDYQTALQRNMPSPIHGFSIGNTDSGYQGGASSWPGLGMLMLQQRALLYLQRRPGDCASLAAQSGGISGVKLGEFGAGVGLDVTKMFAEAGSALAKSIPFIGAALSGIEAIFSFVTAPDMEIIQERHIFCPLSYQVTQAMQAVDAAVANGQSDAASAVSQFNSFIQQVTQTIASKMNLEQGGGANTSGCYVGWLNAHATFRELWYPKIASSHGLGAAKGPALYGAAGGGIAAVTGLAVA